MKLHELKTEHSLLKIKKREIIYAENSRFNGIFIVETGIIKLYKTGIDGRDQILSFAKAGDVIGYESVISNESNSHTAKAVEESTVIFIPREYVLTKDLYAELLNIACNELKETQRLLTDLGQKSIRERLIKALFDLKAKFGVDAENVLQINLPREDYASMIGTVTESVIRLFSEFKDDKLIELDGRKIKLLDESKLKKLGRI